jgi:hypothetical protein
MAPTRFPLEVWGRVFEHHFNQIRDSDENRGGMIQTAKAIELAQVCSTWKVGVVTFLSTFRAEDSAQVITDPYIYRDLNFYDDLSRLERMACALLRSSAQRDKVFRWTRTFFIYTNHAEDWIESVALDAATAIVLHARQLVELSISGYVTPNGLLAVVAVVAPTSLRCLNINWEASALLALTLSCVGSFSNLQSLTLTPRTSKSVNLRGPALMRLDDVDDWVLHKLEKLVVDFGELPDENENETLNELLRFLSRSPLGEPGRLCLILDGISWEDGNAVEALLRRQIALSECHLTGAFEPDLINNVLSFVDARYFKTELIPSAYAAARLSLRLRVLCIEASVSVSADTPLDAFMAALERYRPFDAGSLHIHVHCKMQRDNSGSSTGVPFRWMSAHPTSTVTAEQRSYIRRMWLYAARLKRRGVDVLDYDGYALDGSRFELREAGL